jgi:hypothetical protein
MPRLTYTHIPTHKNDRTHARTQKETRTCDTQDASITAVQSSSFAVITDRDPTSRPAASCVPAGMCVCVCDIVLAVYQQACVCACVCAYACVCVCVSDVRT